MPCQTQTSQQPQQPTTVLPQNLPKTQADWQRFLQRMNELLGSINNAQYATGVNAVPTEYAVYDGTALPALRITGATSAFDTTHAQFGVGSLKLTATASTVTVELASSGYPITLHPNWKWIASLFLLTSAASITGKLSVVTPAQQYDVDISGSPGASWSRLYGDYDLTADASTSCTLLLTLTGVTIGQVFNVEGWMLEPSQGAVLPSPFIMTSGPRTWNQVVGSDAVNTNITTAQTTATTAQSTATTANTTANTANTTAQALNIVNLSMSQGMLGWTCEPTGESANWYGETGANGPNGGTSTYIVHKVSGTTSTLDNTLMPCYPGQIIKGQGQCRGLGSPNGAAAMFIAFYDINKALIGSPTNSNQVSGNGQFQLVVTATAPSNAAFVTIGPSGGYATGTPVGYYSFANFSWNYQPSTLDEVPNGSTYSRVLGAQINNGVVALLGTGRNPIYNPTFTVNTLGTAVNANVNGGYNYDGWTVTATGTYATTIHYSGAVATRILGGFAIPNGYANGPTIQSNGFSVVAGSSYAFRTTIATAISGTFAPAGVTFYQRVILQFLNASGGLVANEVYDVAFTSSYAEGTNTYTGTVPAGAVSANVQLSMYTANTGSATVLPGTTSNYIDCDFYSLEYVQAANIDNEVIDGSTYARIYGSELSTGKHRIGVAGSGYRVGDQRNLLQRTITNYPSKVSPGVSYSASAGTPATATISVAAFTALLGSVSVSYNAASASVTGTNGTNVNYYLYFNDPTYSGGTKTLVATTNQNDLYSGDGYVYVGYVTVAFPSSGSGSGGGTGCPLRTAWVIRRGRLGRPQHVRAGKVRVGDWLLRTDGEWAEVTFSRPELQPCVRLVAEGFGTLGCSVSAPMQLREGSALSIACLAREVVVRRGAACGHAVVTDLHDLGDQWVQHITLANAPDDFFWTGDAKDALFGHHNAKPP